MADVSTTINTKILDLSELTNGDFKATLINGVEDTSTWQGDKILDKLLEVVTKILNKQYTQNRVQGQEYATLVSSLTNTALSLSLEYMKTLETLKLQNKKSEVEIKEVEEKTKFTRRQRIGFNDQIYFKIFEAQANAFGVLFSSGLLNEVDTGPFKISELTKMYEETKTRMNKLINSQDDYTSLT